MTGVTSAVPSAVEREVTSAIRASLDAAEKLEPGRGQLDLGAYVRGVGDTGVAGARLDYQHRLNPSTALFGEGALGYGWGEAAGLNYQATAGLRMRF